MSPSLQKTKLFPPVSHYRLVNRPRLMERLDEILLPACKIGIISASAGSGKTTLVNQWLKGKNNLHSAWISLDDRDSEPARFFRYLISGLQTILSDFGSEALDLLQLPGLDLEELVTLICNDLTRFSEPVVIVMDDFHTIMNPILLKAMDSFVEAKPYWTKIVLLTREDPALSLSRWRAKGQLIELRQEDLRFDKAETIDFLNQCMNLKLTYEQISTLDSQTEGWIAGLQLAALTLQHSKNTDQFILNFSGTNRFILDYLLDEVFLNQSIEIQKFLLETSVLDQLCADLCATIIGEKRTIAQSILEQLVKENLFIFPLDEDRHWYRYHHLFKDLLYARLLSIDKEKVKQLSTIASTWYEKNGDPHLAVEYALKGQNFSLAADLLERHVSDYWRTSDLGFIFLIRHLPEEEIFKRPSLCLHNAWVNVIIGKIDQVLPLVEIAERQISKPERIKSNEEPLHAFAKILHIYMLDFQNQSVVCDGSLSTMYAQIPDQFVGMRNSVAIILGTIFYMEDDFSTAMYYFEDALERDRKHNGKNAIPISVQRMVWVYFKQGRLRDAMKLINKYEFYVQKRGNRKFYIAGILNLMMGQIFLEWNQIEKAENQIREGLRLIKDWPSPSILMVGYCLQIKLLLAKNDLIESQRIFSTIEELILSNPFHPEFRNFLEHTQIQLWLAEKNYQELRSFTHKKKDLVTGNIIYRHEAELIELCRVWLALGNFQEAENLLRRVNEAAGKRVGSRITILTMLAVACKDQTHLAEEYLEEALRLAEPEGYIRTFLELGEPLWKILKNWFTKNQNSNDEVLKAYAYKIILAFEESTIRHSRIEKESNLPEPLSIREREVLQLVSEGLTNQQIATRLVISIRTVKKHIENIHGKLGVQNRTQAATRARSLGLLDNSQ